MKKKKSKRLNQIDRMKAQAWERVFIGAVATEMGYANQTKVCNAGKEVFKLIGSMTYKEFKNVKALLNGR